MPPSWAREGPGRPRGDCSSQFLGRWFISGFASNSSWLREKKEHLYVCKSVVGPMADGGLNFTNTFLRWDSRAGFRG